MTKKYRELPKLSFSETRDLLLEKIEPLNSENVTIDECLGRVSARIYFATNAVPNFVKSPLDGYAMRSCDIRYASEDNPVTLKVVDVGTFVECVNGDFLDARGFISFREVHLVEVR